MASDVWNFVKRHWIKVLIICNVIVMLLLVLAFCWYLPIVSDLKGISEHLTRTEHENTNSNKMSRNHDKEIVTTLVHNDVIKDIDHMEILIKDVRQSISTAEEADKTVIAGINDTLEKWELSVYEDNVYHLKVNDTVVVMNKFYGHHQPSAIFEVVDVVQRKKKAERGAEIFMSSASADVLDIPNATYIGMFNVTLRTLPKH